MVVEDRQAAAAGVGGRPVSVPALASQVENQMAALAVLVTVAAIGDSADLAQPASAGRGNSDEVEAASGAEGLVGNVHEDSAVRPALARADFGDLLSVGRKMAVVARWMAADPSSEVGRALAVDLNLAVLVLAGRADSAAWTDADVAIATSVPGRGLLASTASADLVAMTGVFVSVVRWGLAGGEGQWDRAGATTIAGHAATPDRRGAAWEADVLGRAVLRGIRDASTRLLTKTIRRPMVLIRLAGYDPMTIKTPSCGLLLVSTAAPGLPDLTTKARTEIDATESNVWAPTAVAYRGWLYCRRLGSHRRRAR